MYYNSYVLVPKGVKVNNRAKLLGHSVEVNLRNYTFEDVNYCDVTLELLDDTRGIQGNTENIIDFDNKKLSKASF